MESSRESAAKAWVAQKERPSDPIIKIEKDSDDDEDSENEDFETVEEYLADIGLDDPFDFINQTTDPLTAAIQKGFWLDDPNLLTRHISVRVFAVHRLDLSLRTKKREGMVDFQSLDPFVRVTCAGAEMDTTISTLRVDVSYIWGDSDVDADT